jgi:hypothetical protein
VTRTIRHFSYSPRLRVMALLAWLLLVITPAYGMPLGMTGGMHHAGHATFSTQTADHCHHAAPVKADRSCCGTHDSCYAGPACGCAAACSSVMVVQAMRGFACVSIAAIHWSPRDAAVPRSDFAPPLRPPAA